MQYSRFTAPSDMRLFADGIEALKLYNTREFIEAGAVVSIRTPCVRREFDHKAKLAIPCTVPCGERFLLIEEIATCYKLSQEWATLHSVRPTFGASPDEVLNARARMQKIHEEILILVRKHTRAILYAVPDNNESRVRHHL